MLIRPPARGPSQEAVSSDLHLSGPAARGPAGQGYGWLQFFFNLLQSQLYHFLLPFPPSTYPVLLFQTHGLYFSLVIA